MRAVKQSQESLTSNQTGQFVHQQNYNLGHLPNPSSNEGKNKKIVYSDH